MVDKEPFDLIFNGDVIDGVHHETSQLVSGNLKDQEELAVDCLTPHVDRANKYIHIRGTESHVYKSGQCEERVAHSLCALREAETGRYSRWECWVEFGKELVHFAHHIGTTTSTAYESSAVMKEMSNAFNEAGQFNQRPPSIIVRSHRHRYIEIRVPNCQGVVTPAWQYKTSYVHRVDRVRGPMLGGLVFKLDRSDNCFIRSRIYQSERPEAVIV